MMTKPLEQILGKILRKVESVRTFQTRFSKLRKQNQNKQLDSMTLKHFWSTRKTVNNSMKVTIS